MSGLSQAVNEGSVTRGDNVDDRNDPTADDTLLILEPGRASRNYWTDLWRYRELFLVLAKRDLSVRYRQTAIGVLWAVVRPLLTMIVLTIVFGRVAKLPSDGGTPYPLLVLAAMLPWTLFSTSLSDAAGSLIANANLISKVYFPRLIVPVATLAAGVADFIISLVLLFALFAYYGFMPSWNLVLLPFFTMVCVLATLGPGLWITALNVKYRDFRYVIPFVVQFGLYLSPVGFSSSVVPERWRLAFSLNPMVGVIDGFRWSILGDRSPMYWPGFAVSVAVILVFLWLGLRQFRAMERSFADII